ncbi:hypothetical protein O181_046268 [Austropuccinia psidii MF-1]|uniref:Uncharacterized protein n=1 Tax=Austropuccinia psidii MF-1 TaxID=1389203 RepID=A0A9Q3DRY0_9BASI|nr:hypothetical protein [Austropuccinia psidii MF-1]
MLDKARQQETDVCKNFSDMKKESWDKIHKPPDYKVGDLVLVSSLSFNKIKGRKKLKDYFSGKFMIRALHGPNAMQIEVTSEIMRKHPTFPLSLIKSYRSSDTKLFPLRNETPLEIPPLEG